MLEVRRPRRVVVSGVLGEGALLLRQGRPHAVDLGGEDGGARFDVGHLGVGTPPLLSLHPVGPARMSSGTEMFASNKR